MRCFLYGPVVGDGEDGKGTAMSLAEGMDMTPIDGELLQFDEFGNLPAEDRQFCCRQRCVRRKFV